MFQISRDENGTVHLEGVLDSSQSHEARKVFESIADSCDINFQKLAYISSEGLGILLATQKRLAVQGKKIRLLNMPKHLRKVFDSAMFGLIFEIT